MESENFGVVEQRTWQVAIKNAEGNPEVIDLHYERKLPEVSPEDYQSMFVRQAPPVRIIPSKRNIPSRDVEVTAFLPDSHYPYVDKKAMRLAKIALREIQPDNIVFLGDEIDAVNFSRFTSRQEWQGSLQQSLDEFHTDLAEIKADNPQSKLIMHESNHHIRLERMVREYNGDLLNLRRANAQNELGVLTVGFLLRLDEMGVNYVTGYPNSEYWHEENIKSFHGHEAVTNGSTMFKTLMNETVSVIAGHSHRAELIYKTFRDGRDDRTIFGMNPGSLVDPNLVPSGKFSADQHGNTMPQRQNWQQSVGLLYHNEEIASPHLLPITPAGIQIFGRTYK